MLPADQMPRLEPSGLAEGYVVAAVRFAPGPVEVPAGLLVAQLDRRFGPGVQVTPDGPVHDVLVPAGDVRDVEPTLKEVQADLAVPCWMAITWRERDDVAAGRREVRDVAAIAIASGRDPGLYRLADMPVEYAAIGEPTVRRHLIRIITPVIRQPTLRRTLESLIAANGHRSRAAAELGIHRSTLDYRLGRIGDLTRRDPATALGLQLLAIALVAHSTAQEGPVGSDG